MQPGSILAIYALFWVMSFFVVLPFGVRTDEEGRVKSQPGHAESAPHRFSFARTAFRATWISAIVMALFYLNYINGWIDAGTLDWTRP